MIKTVGLLTLLRQTPTHLPSNLDFWLFKRSREVIPRIFFPVLIVKESHTEWEKLWSFFRQLFSSGFLKPPKKNKFTTQGRFHREMGIWRGEERGVPVQHLSLHWSTVRPRMWILQIKSGEIKNYLSHVDHRVTHIVNNRTGVTGPLTSLSD